MRSASQIKAQFPEAVCGGGKWGEMRIAKRLGWGKVECSS